MARIPMSEPVPMTKRTAPVVVVESGFQPKASEPVAKKPEPKPTPAPVAKPAKRKKPTVKRTSFNQQPISKRAAARRCVWCGQRLADHQRVIHPDCEKIRNRVMADKERRDGDRNKFGGA